MQTIPELNDESNGWIVTMIVGDYVMGLYVSRELIEKVQGLADVRVETSRQYWDRINRRKP